MRAHERWEYLRRAPADLLRLLVRGRHRFTFDWMPMEVRDNPRRYSFCRSCPYADRSISSCSVAGYALRPFALW